MTEDREFEFDVDAIVNMAYRDAGLLDVSQVPSAAQKRYGRDKLNLLSMELEADKALTRQIVFENVQLVVGQSDYTLPASILDLVGDAMYVPAGQDPAGGSGETLVRMASRDDWQRLSVKDADGRPFWFLPVRTGYEVVVRVYPLPQEAGTLRLQAQRYRAKSELGGRVDLERYWSGYLVAALAHRLAIGSVLPSEHIKRLASLEVSTMRTAKARAGQRTGGQMVVTHVSTRRNYR